MNLPCIGRVVDLTDEQNVSILHKVHVCLDVCFVFLYVHLLECTNVCMLKLSGKHTYMNITSSS